MPAPASLADKLRGWIAEGSEIDPSLVIPGRDEGDRPDGLYATALALPSRLQAANQFADGKTRTDWETDWSIQWYRDVDGDAAMRFAGWSHSDHASYLADVAGFRVLGLKTTIQNMDTIIDADWEHRSMMTLTMGWSLVTEPPAATITTVELHLGADVGFEAEIPIVIGPPVP